MAIPFQQVVPPHDRAPAGRVAPVTPWPLPLARDRADFSLRHVKLAGLPVPGRPALELTTSGRRVSGSGHLLTGNIPTATTALDLVRRAVRLACAGFRPPRKSGSEDVVMRCICAE
jgi:hypothetical protein